MAVSRFELDAMFKGKLFHLLLMLCPPLKR